MAVIIKRGSLIIPKVDTSNYVILLIKRGESNSGGRALNSDALSSELAVRGKTKVLNNNTLQFESLHIGVNNNINHFGDATIAGMTTHGWELEIANKDDAGYFPYPVYIVPTGFGGSTIQDYITDPNNTGYEALVEQRINAAITQLTNQGKRIIPYVLFSLGLNNGGSVNQNPQLFVDYCIQHFSRLRQLLGANTPILCTGFGTTFQGISNQIQAVVNQDTTHKSYYISTDNIPYSNDGLHWGYNSMKEVTDRMLIQVKDLLPIPTVVNNVSSTYSLPVDSNVSIGLYKKDGGVLDTIILAYERQVAGTYSIEWDGKNKVGDIVNSDDYEFQIAYHNITTNWLQSVGNTSTALFEKKHRGYYSSIVDMAFTLEPVTNREVCYYTTGYSEGSASQYKFYTDTPGEKIDLFPRGLYASCSHIAVDTDNVYWSGNTYSEEELISGVVKHFNGFVYGTKKLDNSQVIFTNGSELVDPDHNIITYTSVIDFQEGDSRNFTNGNVTGLVVNSNFIILAREGMNHVKVFNKQGALLFTKSIIKASKLALEGNTLYVSTPNQVELFTINNDGSLTTTNKIVSGLTKPRALEVTSTELIIADDSILKFYNKNTLASTRTLGEVGGYKNNALASNYKFKWTFPSIYGVDGYEEHNVFIRAKSDNSIWVADTDNYRVLHYDGNNQYVDQIGFMGATYRGFFIKNMVGEFIVGYRRYKVDYNGVNGKNWQLVANYSSNLEGVNATKYDTFDWFSNPTKLSNGRIYATLRKSTEGGGQALVELADNGIRYTGQVLTSLYPNSSGNEARLDSDGSYCYYNIQDTNSPLYYFKKPLTGFDSSNNLVWGNAVELIHTQSTTKDDVFFGIIGSATNITSSNKLILFDSGTVGSRNDIYHRGPHIGAIDLFTSTYSWKGAYATSERYQGPYPKYRFDIGNDVKYPGGTAQVVDNLVFWNYHGEFWKGSQTNKFHCLLDNGLPLYDYGQPGYVRQPAIGSPGWAGNCIVFDVQKVGNKIYTLNPDESVHSGVSLWESSNVDSLVQLKIDAKAYTPIKSEIDLMAGIKKGEDIFSGAEGWSFSSIPNTSTNQVKTNINRIYDESPDIYFFHTKATPGEGRFISGGDWVRRSLPATSSNYKIAFNVNFDNFEGNQEFGAFIRVVDINGKLLAEMSAGKPDSPYSIYLNGQDFNPSLDVTTKRGIGAGTRAVEIQVNADKTINWKYAGYSLTTSIKDDSASTPAYIEFYLYGYEYSPNYPVIFSIDSLTVRNLV